MPEALLTALCQAVALPVAGNGGAPEWVHLLPAGTIKTIDGRGPYRMPDNVEAFAAASLAAAGGQLVLDENHATDIAAPNGAPSPARGWIKALAARADGIWGEVEWTPEGKMLAGEGRAYRFISPVITHTEDGLVTGLLRASLVNRPNLRGLAALHQEGSDMDLLAKLREALGLAADADEAAILAAITKLKGGTETALQSALTPIAKAAGLKDNADQATILGAVTRLAEVGTKAAGDVVTALQAELTDIVGKFNALQTSVASDKAATFIDGEIRKGRVGVKANRDHYIAMHAVDPARVEKEIGGLPILNGTVLSVTPPPGKDGEVSLNAAQVDAAKALGIPLDKYRATIAAERKEIEEAA